MWVLVTIVQGAVFLAGTLYIEYGTQDIGVWDDGFGAILLFSIAVLLPLMLSTPISALFSLYYVFRLVLRRRASSRS